MPDGWETEPSNLQVQLSVLTITVLGSWWLWNLTAIPVVIEVDGVADTVYTHRRAVGALLSDVGLLPATYSRLEESFQPDDTFVFGIKDNGGAGEALRLSHSLDAKIDRSVSEDGLKVTIERPRPFRISADSRDVLLSSWAGTPADLLADAYIGFDPHDQVIVNGVPAAWDASMPARPTRLSAPRYDRGHAWARIERDPLPIQVYRSIPFTVDDGNLPFTIRTTAQTVGEALREAEITIYLGDDVQPSLGSPVSAGLLVIIQRSTPISLWVDGRWIKTRTRSQTVGDALTEMGIGLTGLDEVSPSLDTPVRENMEIRIVRVREEIKIEEDIIPLETVCKGDPDLLIDIQQVLSPGAEGITRRRYRVRYEDGQEVARTLEDTWVAQEPVKREIAYGQRIIRRTFVDEAGQEITYWRMIHMRATSYSAATAGVSPDEPWYGHTRTGDPMRKGVVAVDQKLIPLRSQVYVPGYGYGDALDTGTAIKNRRIDLGYDDDNLVLWRRWVDVYLLWPPPPAYQIEWQVPNLPVEPGVNHQSRPCPVSGNQ